MGKSTDQTFHVVSTQASLTLAAALRIWLPGQSWKDVRKLVESRRVTINGNVCLDVARRLKEGEPVKVLAQAVRPVPQQEDVKIQHLDGQLVIVEKPAGMTTIRHPEEWDWPARRKQLQPTLEELLPRVIARHERKRMQNPLPRIRPVHRLDRETSGLMVFARTVKAESHLGKQFRKHTIDRRYLSIVLGDIDAPMKIASRLVRDRGDGRRGSTTLPKVGKHAVTHVKPIEQLNGYTLIECRLETGRTHQIRIHLAEQGHPVCGDKVYCQRLFEPPFVDKSRAPRLALHAAELGLDHPSTGERMHFTMPLPGDLEALLRRLRL